MGKVIPLLLALIGLGGGIGAGIALRPDAQVVEINPCGDSAAEMTASAEEHTAAADATDAEYVKLNNQFVVPVVEDRHVTSLVVMSLSLQVAPGNQETVFAREPKLRDGFLQVLFDHANSGGFDGAFTNSANLNRLRRALLEAAQKVLGNVVADVLIVDMVRQDA